MRPVRCWSLGKISCVAMVISANVDRGALSIISFAHEGLSDSADCSAKRKTSSFVCAHVLRKRGPSPRIGGKDGE